MRLPKNPTPEEINRFFDSLTHEVKELSEIYFHRCISLGRPLTTVELEEYMNHPGYGPEFFDSIHGVKKFFRVYQQLGLEGKAGLGKSESQEDQGKLVGYVLEDMKQALYENNGDKARSYGDELIIRLGNLLKERGL